MASRRARPEGISTLVSPATQQRETDVLQAANMMATTTVVDAWPRPRPDAAALAKWREDRSPDWTLMLTDMPAGPEEDGPDDDLINAAETFLRRVAVSMRLPKEPAPPPIEDAALTRPAPIRPGSLARRDGSGRHVVCIA